MLDEVAAAAAVRDRLGLVVLSADISAGRERERVRRRIGATNDDHVVVCGQPADAWLCRGCAAMVPSEHHSL
jgi:hypothetical protein